jgi:NAD(P)-dependent dehydrogenase (short-subunit alcohol dehydrogenase family)
MGKPLVVITGATHGIGKALANAFATEGHRMLLIARHPERLEGVAAELATQAAVRSAAPTHLCPRHRGNADHVQLFVSLPYGLRCRRDRSASIAERSGESW